MAKAKRIRRTQSEWRSLLREKENSDLTIGDFCKQNKIAVSSFSRWQTRLNKQKTSSASDVENHPTDNWLPLSSPPSKPEDANWAIELALPGGVTLRMKSA